MLINVTDCNYEFCFLQTLDPERKKILQIQNSLKNAGDSVARSTQIAIETECIGTGVLGELNTQGEKLRDANVRVNISTPHL